MQFGRGERGFTRRALALLAALSVLVSFALGGQRYFYCAEMNEVNLHACCAHAAEGSDHDGPGVRRDACCTMERFASPATGVRPARGEVPRPHPPAPVGVEASASGRTCSALGVEVRSPRCRRAETEPRERRLRLMVSLT
jgi:hypothetical protein